MSATKSEKNGKEASDGKPPKQDEKKTKKDNEDKKEKERRRDSVTGSPLDTSTSSNSSVDSDGVEVDTDAIENVGQTNVVISVVSTQTELSKRKEASDKGADGAVRGMAFVSKNDVTGLTAEMICKGSVDDMMKPKKRRQRKKKKKNKKKKKKEKLRMRSGEHPVGQMVTGARDTSQEVYATAAAVAAASSDGNGQYPGMGIASKKQAMVIDGMEESNVLYMIDSSSKLARKFTPWIRRFYNALLIGDADEFLSKFSSVSRVLKKSAGRMRYEHMSKDQFSQHVMNGIICAFFDRAENTSILHHLAVTRSSNRPCAMKKHGCCRLIRIILNALRWNDRRALLALRTMRTGKTALHLAAATGQFCQVQALLDFEASSECFDHSGRAPIHYVVMRNDLHLVKLLLWYGADVSLRERLTTPLQLAGLSPTTMLICEYLHARVQALQRVFMQWIKKFVRGVWTPHRALSDLHFIRLAKACDWRSDAPRDLVTRNRKVRINMLETHASNPQHIKKCPLMLLFVVPTFYKDEDRLADASNPQIFCATLQNLNGSIVKLLPFQPLLSSSNWSVGIRSALEKPHNGYFYVYKLPDGIEVDTYTLHLTVNLEEVRLDASHIALAIQAFACGPPDLRHYNELRGLATLTNKSKLD